MHNKNTQYKQGLAIIRLILFIVIILVLLQYFGYDVGRVTTAVTNVWYGYVLPVLRFLWQLIQTNLIVPFMNASNNFPKM